MTAHDPRPDPALASIFRRTLVVMAAIGLAVVTWQLQQLLLLLFASILAAQMFHGLAAVIKQRLRLPFAIALALAVILPLAAIMLIFGLFGSLMIDQFALLAQQLPVSMKAIEAWLATSAAGREVIAGIGSYAPRVETVVDLVQTGLTNFGSGISQLIIVLVAGVYLAAQPGLYLRGLTRVIERLGGRSVEGVLEAIHVALGAWLKAQAVSMAFVAVGTSIGLSLVGLPSALAIGFVAGLCEFVPYLGVILVSVPAVLIGFSISPETGIFTILALFVVQQVQGNVVTPMAQGKLADLPPALTIFSLIAAALLFGPLGVILAVPLTVVGMVLFRRAMTPGLPLEKGDGSTILRP
ncbi:AI-2E family transporter [Polymorphobacter sp.]|uniref:AI-2E family transporter n=1 Tax=Polymorphobacter sp. TaxID=1909290 RepID=UPI003F7068DA